MTQIKAQLVMDTGPTVHRRDRRGRSVYSHGPPPVHSTIDVSLEGDGLAKEVRRLWLDRRFQQQRASPGNTVRFEPNEFDQAVDYFVGLLYRDANHPAPIYLADPGFLHWVRAAKSARRQLYLRVFEATVARTLRVLCAKPKQGHNAQPWRPEFPEQLTEDVKIRKFLKQDKESPGFHDRFLITPSREVIITNSINNWRKYGVTFTNLPRGLDIYRAKTEKLWSMERDSTNAPLFVQEID